MAMDKMFTSPQKVTIPNPSNPYHTQEDMSHLSSITSSTIFLHDGVLRSLNLKTLKDFRSMAHPKLQDAFNSTSDQIEELMALSLNDANSNSSSSSSSSSSSTPNSSADLCRKIIKLSTLHVQSIGLHHRYQWYILEKTWRHQQNLEKSLESSSGILTSGLENTISPTQLGFTLNLCLLIPMMEIYSNENRSVALSSLQLIFDELSSVPVGSLSQTSSISLEKLENLLVEWATNSDPAYQTSGPAAMIALACARGNISSFAKTILMLENLQSPLRSLPVAAILKKLNDSRNSISKPCAIHNDKLVTSWSYDDRLMVDSFQSGKPLGVKTHSLLNLSDATEDSPNLTVAVVATTGNQNSQAQNLLRVTQVTTGNTTPASPPSPSSPLLEEIYRHFMATDGHFLFVTGPEGKGLSKLGSGLGGTLQGWVYNNDVELYPGFLAYANDLLISRPFEVDNRKMNGRHIFGVTIDPVTLKSDKIIVLENTAGTSGGNEDKLQKPFMTLGMTSDGKSVYLVRAELPSPNPPTPTTGSGSDSCPPACPVTPPIVQIFLDIVEVNSNPSTPYATAIPKFLGIPLNRQDDSTPATTPAAGQGQADQDPQQQQQRSNNSNIPTVRRTRSVRLSSAAAPPPPPPPPPGAFPNSLEAFQTSLNFSMKQLQCSLYFTCGNFLTIVSSTNIHYFQAASATLPISLGPTLTASITSRQYCPVISASCSKVIGTQLHFQLDPVTSAPASGEIPAPPVSKQEWANLNPDSCLYQGAILPEMAATYDPVNNVIWTCSGLYIDCWKNSGHVPPWKTNEMLLFPNSTNEDISVGQKGTGARNADIKTVTNVMLRHIGIMANHFNTGDKMDANIGFDVSNGSSSGEENETSCGVLKTMIDLVLKYRNQFEGPELTAILLSLKAIVGQVSRSTSTRGLDANSELYKDLYDVQVMLLCLLNDPIVSKKFGSSPATTAVYHEACNLFADAFDLLYTTPESRNQFFQELYNFFEGHQSFNEFPGPSSGSGSSLNKGEENGEALYGVTGDPTETLVLLEDTVLHMFAKSLDNCSSVTGGFEKGQKWIVDTRWLQRILQKGVEEVKGQMQAQADKEFLLESVIKVTSGFPKASVSTMYINSVVNFLLRSLSIQNGSQSQQSSSSSKSVIDVAVEVFREVLKSGPTLVEACLECLSMTDNPLNLAIYNLTECILKSSVLALGIPQILAFLSLDNLPQNVSLQSRPLLDELTEEVIQLTVAMSFLTKKLNPGSDTSDSEDWSSRVKIFQPWNTKRSYESVHPVRDSIKVKETIVYPKARQLYMKLNSQSASQYDYDRLTFHVPSPTSGGSSSSRKILEFGGNYYGYGNRFFSGPGWARQVVKLTDGNSVSFTFDMKSGREHAVPDKALWGYQFTVFPVMDYSDQQKPPRSSEDLESMDPVNTGFTTITSLHCVDAIQNLVRGLLEGGDVTPEEKATQVLLENRLVASLKWSGTLKSPSEQPQVQRKFPTEVVQRVKRAVGVSPLQMRLSIIEKLRPMELEELYLQCCLLHIGANPYLSSETILSPACESCWSMDPTREILLEIFQNIDTLFRKMMAFYEMEKMLSQEIEEISSHSKDISETFFSDPSFLENPGEVETLAWICYLENDKENPGNVINDVTQMVLALAADGKKPELTRTDELIQETHDKCVYLLEAVPSPQTIIIGPVYPSQKMVIERLHSIHGFISSHLNNPNATVKTFISAVNSRRERASDRIKGLDVLHKVLECSSPSSCLLVIASILLQRGPRVQTILCSGLEKEVIRIFGEVMRTAVAIAEKNPLLHRYSIALLSVTDYDRTDEENLVSSGLVGVLDQLCAYQTGHLTPLYNRSSPTSMTKEMDVLPAELAETSFKASTLAWAAFQVLALQCASWERKVKSPAFLQNDWNDPEHRELPYQISINVTNHLARAAALAALSTQSQAQIGLLEGLGSADKQQSCSPGLSVAIQDVLDLLSNLRSYKIGRAILKQSPCICRLLGLLQDSRLSPRLVLTILKLLHTALPLVDDLDTANFKQLVPMRVTSGATASGRGGNGGGGTKGVPMSSFWAVMDSTPYTQVATMLLSKLADYLVCGSTTKVTQANPVCYTNINPGPSSSSSGSQSSPGLTDSARFERMEVWIHKTSGDNSTVIRQLFVDTPGGQELRPGRGTMHELENELNSTGKCLLYSEEASAAERKAMRISQMGFLTTLVPPGFHRPGQIPVTLPLPGSTRSSPETMCKEKNANLAAWDPARPFLSGHVAENLASEIVQLVRALLSPSGFIGRSDSNEGCSYGGGGISEKSEKSSNESLASIQGSVCTGGDTESLASDQSQVPVVVTTQKSQTQWPGAVQQVICAALKLLPRLMSLQNLLGSVQLESYVYSARMIIAALTVLGGFTETIRAGLEVWIVQEESKRGYLEQEVGSGFPEDFWEFVATKAKVISVSDGSPTAKVEIIADSSGKTSSSTKPLVVSETLTVPTCRLVPCHWTTCGVPNLPSLSRLAQIELAGFLKTLLISSPHPGTSSPGTSKAASGPGPGSGQEFPLKKSLPTLQQIVSGSNNSSGATTANGTSSSSSSTESRQIAQAMTVIRLSAEIKTKSMQVLSLWLKKPEFLEIFLGLGSDHQFSNKRFSSDVMECSQSLKELSKLCVPSHKASSLERQVAYLRLLYRDCTKPPRLPVSSLLSKSTIGGDPSQMRWDLGRAFPKIRSTVFSSAFNSLVFTGDYNVSGGNPRGLVLFGSGSISSTSGYYWEATIVTMEEPGQHADLIVIPPLSIGYSPLPVNTAATSNDIWKYTSGTVMYTTLGRVVHYKGPDPGNWVTIRLDDTESMKVKSGDTIGIGWEKIEQGQEGQNQSARNAARNQSVSLIETLGGSRRHRARNANQMIVDSVTQNSTSGVRGNVYFTLNGRRLPPTVEQSNCSLHPILHVQKKQMVVFTNFGERPFVFAEANKKTPQQKPAQDQDGILVPSQSQGQAPVVTAETGTSNADSVLLRRVSDSLQDLNLVFNISLHEIHSEQEMNQRPDSATGSSLSGVSTAATRGDNDDRNMLIMDDDTDDDPDVEADDWVVQVQMDDLEDMDAENDGDDDEDDDDDDGEDDGNNQRNYRSINRHPPTRMLPPSPTSGQSNSGILPGRRTNTAGNGKPPRRNRTKAFLRNASSLQSLESSLAGKKGSKKKNEVVAKAIQKTTEYNPVKSLEYFMGHSPTAGIRVFQGPPRYTCPCSMHCPTPLDFLMLDTGNGNGGLGSSERERRSSVDSLDSYEDDEEDDIHSLLVRAWEQQVFPVIRRRFRNESERRDGLEQIRGALQLGMLDIARQTVEFLYEEGGGIPRDLHFPTLEEVRQESARCTMDKLKPGMNVVIRPLQEQQQQDLGSVPGYAVSGMLRTFGLTGEVLEVDLSNELIFVETYLETEGVLVRFWYPVQCLDKSNSSKKPMLSTQTVNMFKLHSNLITMESSLCKLYARQCYLSISEECQVTQKVNPVVTKISEEFDLDSIQILSDNCLSTYPASMDLFTYNLQCESPSLRFLQESGNPTRFFYRSDHDHAKISKKVREKIRQAMTSSSDTEDLNKLTQSMLSFMEDGEKFPKQEIGLDRITDLEVSLPGMAFTLVTFKGPQNGKQMTQIDNTIHPCLHLSSYDSSDLSRHLMACYPMEPLHIIMHRASTSEDGTIISHTAPTTAGASNSSAASAVNKTMRKRHSRFPPVLCPTERLHCSISETSLPDILANVQGIPKEFPLALLFLQELVQEFHSNMEKCSNETVTFAVTQLLDFLDSFHLCPVVKDWIFAILAELTRLRGTSGQSWKPIASDKVARSSTPNRLFLELLLLRDKETSESSTPNHMTAIVNALSDHLEASSSNMKDSKGGKPFAPASLMFHISNFIASHQKSTKSGTDPNFSFYFNSLNDLCLALNEVSEIMVNPYEIIPCASNEPSPAPSPKPSTSNSSSAVIPLGALTDSTTAAGTTTPNRRVYAKAIRRRPYNSNKDLRSALLQSQKDSKNQGKSGQGTSGQLDGNKKGVGGSPSEDGLLSFAKASEVEWFNNEVVITRVLRDIVWHSPQDAQCVEAGQVLIGTVLDRLKTSTVHNRLLVVHGAPVDIDGMSIEASLIKALRGCGGIHGTKMWISGNSAVVEIRALAKVHEAYDILKQNRVWYPLEDYLLYPPVSVFRVDEFLQVYSSGQGTSAGTGTTGTGTSALADLQIGEGILARFFRSKICSAEGPSELSFKGKEALSNIFTSCYLSSVPFVVLAVSHEEEEGAGEGEEEEEESGMRTIVLNEEQINFRVHGNLMDLFASAVKSGAGDPESYLKEMLGKFGEKVNSRISRLPKFESDGETEKKEPDEKEKKKKDEKEQRDLEVREAQSSLGLSLQGFLDWCTDLAKTQPHLLWKGLLAAGYDLRLERVWLAEDSQAIYNYFHNPETWNLEKDAALIGYVDQFSQSLHIDPTRIQPPELNLTESDYLNPAFVSLQGVDISYLRVRWGMFQKINTLVSKKLLAHSSLHSVKSSRRSLANLLHDSKQLILYYIKDTYLYKIIHVSASRGSDTPTPEITIDPVSSIGTQDDSVFKKQLSQIIQQMSTITTSFYCVPPAQGADPALPLSVKFQGEEVPGLSGSFRHFLLQAVKELQSETVKLLCRCPSADAGKNKDNVIITPGKMSYGEEDFLYFLGQLIGISIRSDAPLALSLLKSTWRSLLLSEKESNDHLNDLMEADVLCATYLNKLDSLATKMTFDNFLSLNAWPKFQYPSMDNTSIVPLCSDGSTMRLNFGNRNEFINLVKQLREKELRCSNKVTKILTGLATIIPLPALLGLFTSEHLELRIAGSPEVNLSLLKSHTHYQVGVSENDPHIMYFWAALESFTPEELKKFIKFSCNLERLPITCPCQSVDHHQHHQKDGTSGANSNVVHVPPFPMKIAPIDLPPSSANPQDIDRRLIRVETCLFLIRLPPYSSLQVTRQQLLFAINCRDDPLSG